ncbi:MAG: hypothetical protein JWM85_2586, partial [Acidimicrobiaceae bacterium]|nr:hypothetical protein [Acidimicrobiaceae bacterium]
MSAQPKGRIALVVNPAREGTEQLAA